MHRKLEVNEYCNLTELCWPHILPGSNIRGSSSISIDLDLTQMTFSSVYLADKYCCCVKLGICEFCWCEVLKKKKKGFFCYFGFFFWFCLLKYFSFINITLSSIFCSAAVILQSLAWSLIKPLNTAQPLETNPFVLSIKEHLLMVFS